MVINKPFTLGSNRSSWLKEKYFLDLRILTHFSKGTQPYVS